MSKLKREFAVGDHPEVVVTVSSAGGSIPIFDVAYGVGKAAKDRLASDMAGEK